MHRQPLPGASRMLGIPGTSPFRSFLQGGFEGSSHGHPDGSGVDVIASTLHDVLAASDYRMLAGHGLRTVRDSLRWRLIEPQPGVFDWSSWTPMLDAAQAADVQVVWDLCHYGVPAWIDPLAADFPKHFAAYCAAAAGFARCHLGPCLEPQVYCVINEISYWVWAAERGQMHPHTLDGPAFKRRLVAACLAGMNAIRGVDPGARFLHPEPLIHIAALEPQNAGDAEQYRMAQFEVFDMLQGRLAPELGGAPHHLDVIGCNYYFDNQWFHEGGTIPFGAREYRPLRHLLGDVHARFGRPIVISETGAEGGNGPGWLRHVIGEAHSAVRLGIPVLGVCLYPVADYPGWIDDRHCRCGLLRLCDSWSERFVDGAIAEALAEAATLGPAFTGAAQGPALTSAA